MSAIPTATAVALVRATRSSAPEGGTSTSVVLPPPPAPVNRFAKHSTKTVPREAEVAFCENVDKESGEGAKARKRCWWLSAWWSRFSQGIVPEWECLADMFPSATNQQRKQKLKDFLQHCWFFGDEEVGEGVPGNLREVTKEWYEGFFAGKRWKEKDGKGNFEYKNGFTFYDTRVKHGDDHAVQVSAIIVGNNNSVD